MEQTTPNDDASPEGNVSTAASWTTSILISVFVLAAAGGIALLTFYTEPTAEKAGAAKTTAMLVDVIEVSKQNYQPEFVAQGTVEPAQDITLSPRVGGQVTTLAPNFVPGGFVQKGDRLLQIDPVDFRNALAQRKSELRQAKSSLAVEQGRQEAAKAEYDYVDEDLSSKNKALLLREPQLEAAKAEVDSAQAAVDQAQTNLARASIEAPFDAHVVQRNVNVGSQVAPGDDLGRLIGLDAYWIGVELPSSKLQWVTVADDAKDASKVRVRNERAWPEDTFREGYLFKKVGVLDDATRMARLLAKIPDPLARHKQHEGQPALTIEEFVEVRVTGRTLEGVVRLNRDYIREDDTVWVMRDGKLRIQPVDITVRDPTHAYISDGLSDGARIVTTNISTVTEGAALRLKKTDADTDESSGSTDENSGGGE